MPYQGLGHSAPHEHKVHTELCFLYSFSAIYRPFFRPLSDNVLKAYAFRVILGNVGNLGNLGTVAKGDKIKLLLRFHEGKGGGGTKAGNYKDVGEGEAGER